MLSYSYLGGAYIGVAVVQLVIAIGMAVWVHKDAQQRNLDETMWTCIVCFCGCIGLIAYLITRSNSPVRRRPQQYQYGQPQGGYTPSQGGYNQPQGGYGQPQGGYGQPQGGYGQPQGGPGPQTSQPSGSPQYGQTTPPSSSPSSTQGPSQPQTTKGVKHCKFCNSEAPANAKHCPICGGDEFTNN